MLTGQKLIINKKVVIFILYSFYKLNEHLTFSN